MSQAVMIEANSLCKQFGSFLAVRDVTFSIGKGEVVAFLGPNGAGKTTTMRLLTGFVAPTHGSAYIAGINVQDDRIAAAEHLGYLPENGPLYPDMTPDGLASFLRMSARDVAGPAARSRWTQSWHSAPSKRLPTSRSASCRKDTASGFRWRRRFCTTPRC